MMENGGEGDKCPLVLEGMDHEGGGTRSEEHCQVPVGGVRLGPVFASIKFILRIGGKEINYP